MKRNQLFFVIALLGLTLGCKDNKKSTGETAMASALVSEQLAQTAKTTDANAQTPDGEEADGKDEPQSGKQAATKKNARPMVYCIAADGYLNIREMPVPGSKVVGRLTTGGAGAEYRGSTSKWHAVRYNGVDGFVNGNYAMLEGLEEMSMDVPEAKGRKVYYIVIGSYTDLAEAKKSVEVLPDALDACSIYRTIANGNTIYRLCTDCTYDRNKAREQMRAIKEYLGRDAWVWENDGVAPCVYQGIDYDGEPTRIIP